MAQPFVSVTYAVSIHDMLALAPVLRARVEAVLQPHLALALGELTTQRRERILPLYGVQSDVRRAIYRAQAVAQVGERLRFYVTYAPGLWDVAPSLKAIALMRVQEGIYGRV
jgi:hypothetical protein